MQERKIERMEWMRLRSSDNQTFEIEEKFGRESKIIRRMIDSGCADSSTIALPGVKGEIVAKIIEYLNLRHAVVADDAGNSSLEKALKRFDVEYVDGINPGELLPLFVAVKCLDIGKLLELMVKKMYNTVKGKTPDEIRRIFNFVDDDTNPHEEARIRALIAQMR